MLSFRLVHMIESHAEQLTRGVVHDLQTNPRTPAYHKLTAEELHHRAYAVYRNLGRWLNEKTDEMMEAFYGELGKKRHAEGIPVCEVVYALLLVKYHLRDYIRASGLVDSAVEIYQEQELHRLVGHFFDRAIYYTVKSYEGEAASHRAHAAGARAH
ncbi:MAG: hypothetical protein ABSA70_16080 [Terriglobia bacterium]